MLYVSAGRGEGGGGKFPWSSRLQDRLILETEEAHCDKDGALAPVPRLNPTPLHQLRTQKNVFTSKETFFFCLFQTCCVGQRRDSLFKAFKHYGIKAMDLGSVFQAQTWMEDLSFA